MERRIKLLYFFVLTIVFNACGFEENFLNEVPNCSDCNDLYFCKVKGKTFNYKGTEFLKCKFESTQGYWGVIDEVIYYLPAMPIDSDACIIEYPMVYLNDTIKQSHVHEPDFSKDDYKCSLFISPVSYSIKLNKVIGNAYDKEFSVIHQVYVLDIIRGYEEQLDKIEFIWSQNKGVIQVKRKVANPNLNIPWSYMIDRK